MNKTISIRKDQEAIIKNHNLNLSRLVQDKLDDLDNPKINNPSDSIVKTINNNTERLEQIETNINELHRITAHLNRNDGKILNNVKKTAEKLEIEELPEKKPEPEGFECSGCSYPVSKGMKKCPSCKEELNWEDIKD